MHRDEKESAKKPIEIVFTNTHQDKYQAIKENRTSWHENDM